MKSLNRTLSLVLVLAMVLGLMGFASAATFTDDTTIQYKEAVGVMSGIGAINGYTDGTFKPTATITREEAAKMITYAILGPTVAKTLTVTSTGFSDVASTRWSAPFISYCVSKGIINGMGDGTFAPTANVTGYQVAKMLLCAVGYGKMNEYVGSGWELNVAVDANKNDIFENAKTVSYTAAATREETALYVFNAITKIDQVQYVKLLDTYMHNGDTIAHDVYSLTSSSATPDAFGRPATTWTVPTNKTIATITDAPVLSYTTAVTSTALSIALQNAGYTLPSSVCLYVNNVHEDITLSDTTYGGNGMVLEVYANTSKVVSRIVVVNSHLATYTTSNTIVADNAATTTVDERSFTMTLNGHTIKATPATTEGFDAAYAAVVAAKAALKSVALVVVAENDAIADGDALKVTIPNVVTGKVTKATSAGVYTIGGADYKLSYTNRGTTYTVGSTANFILDTYGYIIGATEVTGEAAAVYYGVALEHAKVAYAPATLTTFEVAAAELVKFVDSTGATKTLNAVVSVGTDGATTFTYSGNAGSKMSAGTLFAYTLDASGKIASITPAAGTVASGTTITKGYAQFNSKYMTDKTVVFYKSGTTYAVYTGYANVLTKTTSADGTAITNTAGDTYSALLLPVSAVAPTTAAKLAYFASTANTVETVTTASGTATTVTYTDVYLDGVKGSLTFSAAQSSVAAGDLYAYTVTSGVATLGTKVDDASTAATTITSVQSGYFVASGVHYTSSSTAYYVISTSGSVTSVAPTTAISTSYKLVYTDATGTTAATVVYVTPVA